MTTVGDAFGLALRLIAGADAELLRIAVLSLQVSGSACAVGAVVGLAIGAWLAAVRFPGHGIAVWLVETLLALPAVVVGLAVYLLLSRAGPLGSLGILFTPAAMVVAQSVLVVPLIAALSRRLVAGALLDGGDQLRSLGATRLQSALLMLVHERMGVLTVLLAAFGRAIAEVGAVMIVGGNIAGVTRVMTTAIALETSRGDLALALALGIVLLAVVGIVNAAIGLVAWRGGRMLPGRQDGDDAVPAPVPNAENVSRPEPLPLIALHAVTVRFGGAVALRDITLTLARGDRLALVGANGSGKTTLLRLLHGLVACDGRVERHALRPEGRTPVAAMLFQRPFLLDLSVVRNLRLALWLGGVPRREHAARCRDALARVGLAAQAARPARALSGGQQQRLALARAWALRPDILFLDEPTASLDPSAKREIETLIERIAAGVTVVMSTHNLGQAKRLATRLAYLEGGRLVVERPVERFFGDPLPSEAALFLKGELPWT